MTQFLKRTLISLGVIATLSAGIAIPAYGAEATPVVATQTHNISGDFVKKKYNIKGDWQILQQNGQTILRLSDDFKTKKGPDLKIFLSPQSIADVTGQTATQGSVLVSALTSNKGTQDYIIPSHVNLADFQSVLIHCEAFSVLWGGGEL
jgi:hypothetical protein